MKKLLLLIVIWAAAFQSYGQQRIISAGSGVTELFFALGAQQQLVAVDLTSRYFLPKDESRIVQVGYHRQLSAEGLLALSPTVLIGSDEMGPETTLSLLRAAGVKVVITPSGHGVDDLYQRIELIAKLTDTETQAKALKQKVSEQVAQLAQQRPDSPPKVIFLMIGGERPNMIGGADTEADDIISMAGGVNPAATQVQNYKPVSFEAVVEMQPDYILVSERAVKQAGGMDALIDSVPLLKSTPAIRHRRVIALPSMALIGGMGLQSIAAAEKLSQRFSQDQ